MVTEEDPKMRRGEADENEREGSFLHSERGLERKFAGRASNGNLELTLRNHPPLLDDIPDGDILVAEFERDLLRLSRL